MRITKFGHACVRVEHDGQVLVLDPGSFTTPDAVDGATAVLITHEHVDHYSLDHLRRTDARVFTIEAVAAQIRDADPAVGERTTVVHPGETFDAGLSVRAIGEQHAIIHPELPTFANSGYLVSGDQTLFHPGDAFTVPDQGVDVLCIPVCAPWSKMSEVMDYARATTASHYLAVHDMIYSEIGLALVDGRVTSMIGEHADYARLQPGQDLSTTS
jgi:L-ascorbate metabolism protein UlaG (beta-lactamase superfamily)